MVAADSDTNILMVAATDTRLEVFAMQQYTLDGGNDEKKIVAMTNAVLKYCYTAVYSWREGVN